MSAPKCLFLQGLEGLTEAFDPGPDGHREIRPKTSSSWWTFRPRKKIFSPPPRNPPIRRRPSRPLPSRPGEPPPPLLGFSIKNRSPPPPSRRLGLPLPPPRAEKTKNIRNVHQVFATEFKHVQACSGRTNRGELNGGRC